MQHREQKQQLAEALKDMKVRESVSQVSTMKYGELAELCIKYSKLESMGLTEAWFKGDNKSKTPLRKEAMKEGISTIDGQYFFFFQLIRPFYMKYLLEYALDTKEQQTKQPSMKI